MADAGKYTIVKTIFPDPEWQAMHRLARERDVAPDAILAEATGAWLAAGVPEVEVPPHVLHLYAGKDEQLGYYKALRWWLKRRGEVR